MQKINKVKLAKAYFQYARQVYVLVNEHHNTQDSEMKR